MPARWNRVERSRLGQQSAESELRVFCKLGDPFTKTLVERSSRGDALASSGIPFKELCQLLSRCHQMGL